MWTKYVMGRKGSGKNSAEFYPFYVSAYNNQYESNKFGYQGEQITFATATGEILPVNQNELL